MIACKLPRICLAIIIVCVLHSLLFSFSIFAIDQKESVVIAWESKPRTFDPRYAVDANSQYLENLLHCSLVDFDGQGNLIADLAKKWQWKNSTTLEFEIKDSFRYSDGNPVKLEDIKSTYDFFSRANPKHPSPRAVAFENIKKIVIEGSKLIFYLEHPDASFLTNLVVGILPKGFMQDKIIEASTNVKGCGPFLHKQSNLNEIHLSKNTFYPSSDINKVGGVTIKIVKDENTRFFKLQKGEVDLVQNGINYEKIANLSSYKDLKLMSIPSLKTTYLGFNFKDPILKDIRVRKAITLALDKKAIIRYILKGLATPATTMLPSSSEYYNSKLKPYEKNIQEANKLLDQGGYKYQEKTKSRFSLTIKTTNNPTRTAIAKAIAGDLNKIGIKLKIKTLEWGRFKYDVEKGLIQLWTLSWVGYKDPDIYRYAFSTDSMPPHGGNRGNFSHPELDSLLKEGIRTIDLKERKNIYLQVQQIIHEQIPYVFLFHENHSVVMSKKISGYKLYADGRYFSLLHVDKL